MVNEAQFRVETAPPIMYGNAALAAAITIAVVIAIYIYLLFYVYVL